MLNCIQVTDASNKKKRYRGSAPLGIIRAATMLLYKKCSKPPVVSFPIRSNSSYKPPIIRQSASQNIVLKE